MGPKKNIQNNMEVSELLRSINHRKPNYRASTVGTFTNILLRHTLLLQV